MRGQPPSRINYSSSDLRQKYTIYKLFAVPIQDVPFIASLNSAEVMGSPSGCRLSVRQSCRAQQHDKIDNKSQHRSADDVNAGLHSIPVFSQSLAACPAPRSRKQKLFLAINRSRQLGVGLDDPGFQSRRRQQTFQFSVTSKPALRPTQPHKQRPGGKAAGTLS